MRYCLFKEDNHRCKEAKQQLLNFQITMCQCIQSYRHYQTTQKYTETFGLGVDNRVLKISMDYKGKNTILGGPVVEIHSSMWQPQLVRKAGKVLI